MAHKTKIGGTAYEISGGKTKIGGTAYSISKGRTKVGGTGYDISFSNLITITLVINATTISGSINMVQLSQTQSITVEIPSSIKTYADLAAASEYNTLTTSVSTHHAQCVVSTSGVAGIRFTDTNSNLSATVCRNTATGVLASAANLYDGMTLELFISYDVAGEYSDEGSWGVG